MAERLKVGFIAGLIGGFILAAIMYIMQATNLAGPPGFVGIYRTLTESNTHLDYVIATLLFAVSGGIWGAVFTSLVRFPSTLKGAVFGFAPSLWLWLVAAPVTGKPPFNGFTAQGVLLPIVFNVLIWGSFVGWYCSRRITRFHA